MAFRVSHWHPLTLLVCSEEWTFACELSGVSWIFWVGIHGWLKSIKFKVDLISKNTRLLFCNSHSFLCKTYNYTYSNSNRVPNIGLNPRPRYAWKNPLLRYAGQSWQDLNTSIKSCRISYAFFQALERLHNTLWQCRTDSGHHCSVSSLLYWTV